jgi:hypothetical protein
MKIIELLNESRVDDFKVRYSQKFSPEQTGAVISNIPQKFLEWTGKNLDNVNFNENLTILSKYLKEFDKISSNLPKTDINGYKSSRELFDAINDYHKRPRRNFRKVEGGNVVYDDGDIFVVNPQTHTSSCYYGKGTKWCTAADSNFHFNKYNEDGKLFYILNTTKQSSDVNYKIALLKKFDGEEIFYNAVDTVIKNPKEILGEKQYEIIMREILSYMSTEYAEQIKVFSDKESAKKERERLERLRIQRIINQRLAEAQSRREDNEWELNEDCPEEGLKAHALLIWLESNNDVEVKTTEDIAEIARLEVEIERLNNEYDQAEDVNPDILDAISVMEDELEELKNKIDVYNIIPTGSFYNLTEFEVIGAGLENRRYAVGDESEVKDSSYESVKSLIDDIGYEGFSAGFAESHINTDEVVSYAEEFYESDIRDNPDVYFEDSDRELSSEQEEEINALEMRIERANEEIDSLEELKDYDGEDEDEIEDKINELRDNISEYEDEIESIKDDPQGDIPEDLIEEKVEEFVSDVRRDPSSFMKGFGLDWKDYIDEESFIEDVVNTDGYGHTLNSYDGNIDEYKVMGEWYYVMRID